jgi:hypothetical protein
VLAAIGKVETNHGRLQASGVTSGATYEAATTAPWGGGPAAPPNMIVAPYTGAVVRIQPMIRNDYIGASGRPPPLDPTDQCQRADYFIAASSSLQACSQRRHASAQTRQCSCI